MQFFTGIIIFLTLSSVGVFAADGRGSQGNEGSHSGRYVEQDRRGQGSYQNSGQRRARHPQRHHFWNKGFDWNGRRVGPSYNEYFYPYEFGNDYFYTYSNNHDYYFYPNTYDNYYYSYPITPYDSSYYFVEPNGY